MARKNLGKSLELMFGHEGGYVNNPNDKGGPTKFGITHGTLAAHRGVASVSASQVKALTLDEATQIYIKSYWGLAGCDSLPSGIDYAVFDTAVNSGVSRAVKILQKVLNFKGNEVDGVAGEHTLDATKNYAGGQEKLVRDYCNARMAFLKGLSDFKTFGRGWTIRVTGVDPKGQYKKQLGVVGNALILAKSELVDTKVVPVAEDIPSEIPTGKGSVTNTSLSTIVTKPEIAGPLVAGATSIITPFASGSVILQATLAFVVVVAVLIGAYFIVKRIRRD